MKLRIWGRKRRRPPELWERSYMTRTPPGREGGQQVGRVPSGKERNKLGRNRFALLANW